MAKHSSRYCFSFQYLQCNCPRSITTLKCLFLPRTCHNCTNPSQETHDSMKRTRDQNKDLTPKDQDKDKDLTPKDKDLLDLTPQGQGPNPQGPGQGQGLEIC